MVLEIIRIDENFEGNFNDNVKSIRIRGPSGNRSERINWEWSEGPNPRTKLRIGNGPVSVLEHPIDRGSNNKTTFDVGYHKNITMHNMISAIKVDRGYVVKIFQDANMQFLGTVHGEKLFIQ